MAEPLPRVLITPGEPAGIGPELVVKLLYGRNFPAQVVVLSDAPSIAREAAALALEINLLELEPNLDSPRQPHRRGEITVLPQGSPLRPVSPGKPDPENAPTLVNALQVATDLCMNGEAQALVTGPIDKAVINRAGISFSGHTELLAERTNTGKVVMMLASDTMRVALLTTHIPLAAVAAAVTTENLEASLSIIQRDLTRLYGIEQPRIAICGLNPHAGEGGYLGREEQETIIPALQRLRRQGMNLIGPLPADSAFTPTALARCDVVLAMYHDQGLPPLKLQADHRAINVTLGLPMIRTSVDHGTAYDIAGTGNASPNSLEQAVLCAIEFARRRH